MTTPDGGTTRLEDGTTTPDDGTTARRKKAEHAFPARGT